MTGVGGWQVLERSEGRVFATPRPITPFWAYHPIIVLRRFTDACAVELRGDPPRQQAALQGFQSTGQG